MPLREKIIGIGVDIVSRNRIERFLADHPFECLKRILAPSEQVAFREVRDPVHFFARCFTAKEASFKAGNGVSWGEAALQGIEILMKDTDRFEVISNFSGSTRPMRGEGEFFEIPGGTGARVTLWETEAAGR